jgi:hypothetical protein
MSDRSSWPTMDQLFFMSNDDMRKVDPLVMNLIVAKGIPSLADLDIGHYVALADQWAEDSHQIMRQREVFFHQTPEKWKNDVNFFRVGILCWYVDEVLGVHYPDDLAEMAFEMYANPQNVFVHGLMDQRRGSCASMPVLHVAICWRFGWPVYLVCAGHHLFCRYDDGKVQFNIEATTSKMGGFRSHPDEYYRKQYGVPSIAVTCGSDMRIVAPHEMLALFLSIRAGHFSRVMCNREGELDLLLARYLFPNSRVLYTSQMETSIERGLHLFERGESGHPVNVGNKLRKWLYEEKHYSETTINTSEMDNAKHNHSKQNTHNCHAREIDDIFAKGW